MQDFIVYGRKIGAYKLNTFNVFQILGKIYETPYLTNPEKSAWFFEVYFTTEDEEIKKKIESYMNQLENEIRIDDNYFE